jgi:hypothetical protein
MNSKLLLILGVGIITILLGIVTGPIIQPDSYHRFADQRSWLNLPNTWNVLSSGAFALAGIYGLFSLKRAVFIDRRERLLWVGVSWGLILTALGSGFYHLDPNNAHLAFDRLPMTLVFLSLVAILIAERINIRLGLLTWPILIVGGVASVLIWKMGGDLRYYLGVQVFTFLSVFVMLLVPSSSRVPLTLELLYYPMDLRAYLRFMIIRFID